MCKFHPLEVEGSSETQLPVDDTLIYLTESCRVNLDKDIGVKSPLIGAQLVQEGPQINPLAD